MTPREAYYHCRKNGRNKKLEKIIATDLEWSYRYAKNVIKDRWPEAENIIATDSYYACLYAQNIIKGRLPENMHNAMLIHADNWAKHYLENGY